MNQPAKKITKGIVIDPKILPNLLIRCRRCWQFKLNTAVNVGGCPVCDWHTACCDDCTDGGEIERSVVAHVRYFASPRGERLYGSTHAGILKRRRALKAV